jgi:hypothetical protein
VTDPFIVAYQFASDLGRPNPLGIGGDHPAAGPTGPQACGACYPTTRVNHSYYYGTASSPLCPGSVFFNDGVCDSQLLMDASQIRFLSVEDRSWGTIKHLYR